MIRLSLCMIAKDEEAFLPDCLESVRGVVDEIVLVDTGSADRTVEIAARYGAKIVHFPWTGDFAAARNVSLDHASGDWILVLDADERLDAVSKPLLRSLLEVPGVAGYSLICQNMVGSEAGAALQLAPVFRLFLNRPDIRFEGMIHEQANPSARRTGLETVASEVRILHLGYLQDAVQGRDKRQRNLGILQRQAEIEPENPFVHFNLGEALKLLNRDEEALRHYERALDLLKCSGASPRISYVANLYFSLCDLLRRIQAHDRAQALLGEAIALYPTYPDLYYVRGFDFFDQGRFQEAIAQFRHCMTLDGVSLPFATDPGVTGHKALEAIADCHVRLDDRPAAKAHLARAIDLNPRPGASLLCNLGILRLEDGEAAEAVELFERAIAVNPDESRAWLNLAVLRLERGDFVGSAAAWQQVLRLDPDLPEARTFLAEALAKHGDLPGATSALTQEIEHRPDSPRAWRLLGVLRLIEGDLQKAEQALERFPGDAEAQALGCLAGFMQHGQLAPQRPPDPVLVKAWCGLVEWALLADRTSVVQTLLDGLDVLGAVSGLEFELGRTFLRQRMHELALGALLRAQQRTPDNAMVYATLGDACLASGEVEDARALYARARDLDPTAAYPQQQLSRLSGAPTT